MSQVIACATLNVFDGLLKLELKAHLLPENRTERQITSTIVLTNPNMIVTEDKGTLANTTPLHIAFVAMNYQLLHRRASIQAAIKVFAIPSMDQVVMIPFQNGVMFHR